MLFTFLVLTQGCEKQESDFQPLSGGFGVVTKAIGIDSGPGAKLFYKDASGKLTLIWPFFGLNEEPMLFTNDMAFLVGDMPDDKRRFGGSVIYLAVQAPGPALDVSEDILKLWAESEKLDYQKVRGQYAPSELKAAPDGIEVQYLRLNYDDTNLPATYVMSWQQVSNLIQNIKRTGKKRIMEMPHVVYLKNYYGPDTLGAADMPVYRNTNYYRTGNH